MMRDPGLDEAVRAAGGVSELARQLGISQPSVSNWTRVPAERVLLVEAATGIDRKILRPDLYGDPEGNSGEIDEVAAARAQEYALLSAILAHAPDAKLLETLATLRGDATPLGLVHAALAQAASETTVEQVEREYFNLFIGIGRGELLPYGSFYLTGFLNDRPLSRLREDLARLGIANNEGNYEPEDHAAILCEIMSGLANKRFPGPADAGIENFEKLIFEQHLAPWIGQFFSDLERAETADFYRHVGTLGRIFVEIETEAFSLPS
jgi:TorA maturation chaperone TorD/DNA-binding transcriptional regulator YdaS (Cro superfamily)